MKINSEHRTAAQLTPPAGPMLARQFLRGDLTNVLTPYDDDFLSMRRCAPGHADCFWI